MRVLLRASLLIVLLSAGGRAFGQAPAWEVDPAAFETSMTVVGVYVPDGAPSHNAGDRVAAFVGGEVRGMALPVRVGDHNVFFLTVYGHGNDGVVTFAVYDALHAQVRPLAQTETFTPDVHRGRVDAPLRWTPRTPATSPDPPDWVTEPVLDPGAFEHSLNAIGEVYVGGVQQGHPEDRVAAFVDGALRGVGTAQSVSGGMRYYLTIYGHGADHDASVVLHYYDAAQGVVRSVAETMVFRADAVYGLEAPLRWHAESTAGSAPRWALTPTPEAAVDPHAFEGSMNLIARLGDTAAPGQRVAAFVGGEVRGVAETDADGILWMTIYGGPADDGAALVFYWWDDTDSRLRTLLSDLDFKGGTLRGQPGSPLILSTDAHRANTSVDWAVDTGRYPATMSVIARVQIDGAALVNPDARIGVFSGHEVRGVGAPTPEGDYAGYVFLTVHGETAGDALEVQIYDPATGTVYDADARFDFATDAVLGRIDAPLQWRAQAAHVFVWPGDADGNGVIDDGDVAPIHTHFGATGPSASPAPRGEAFSRPVWPDYPGAVHADTDLNGNVNQNDVLLVGAYYGERSTSSQASAAPTQAAAVPVGLSIQPSTSTVRPGDELVLSVQLDGAPLGVGGRLLIDASLFEVLGFSFGTGVQNAAKSGTLLTFARLLEAPSQGIAFAVAGKRALLPDDAELLKVRLRVRDDVTPQEHEQAATDVAALDLAAQPLTVTSTSATITLIASTAVDEDVARPRSAVLEAPSPHPVRDVTRIQFVLRDAGHVRLTVYDVVGRQVAMLVDGVRSAGAQQVQWQTNGLPAGVYFVRMETGGVAHTRQVAVVR